jgi:hypothetical protein
VVRLPDRPPLRNLAVRRTVVGAVAALVLVVVAGCGPDRGYVRAKHYEAAYTSFSCTRAGGNPCVLMPTYHGPEWQIDVQNRDGQAWIDVNKATYDRVNVGDYWNGS